MTAPSAWCWTPPGFIHTAAQHRACQMRQDEGQVGACSCGMHGGHESPSVERESRPERDMMGTQKTAPGGALTPESQGLADWIGVD